MFKPVTKKQTNKLLPFYGKYVSFLFGVEGIGNNKREAEENLFDLMQKFADHEK